MTISNVVIFDQLLPSMCALCADLRGGCFLYACSCSLISLFFVTKYIYNLMLGMYLGID